jgi:outer membrane protein TolC
VRAQANLDIAKTNFANADTLYTIARGRYNIGTITESEMLGLEVRRLTEESNMMDALIEVDDTMQELRSYLGITDDITIEASSGDTIPDIVVDGEKALAMALESSPDITNMDLRLKDSEREVARAKSLSGVKADIYIQFGLTQTNRDLGYAYRNLLDQQSVRVGVQIPILDWGRGKGQVQVARSRSEMEQIRVEQDMNIFEQNVVRIVKQFNQQAGKVTIAAKADATAQHRNSVTIKLYMLGRATILDLNAATAEKDAARRNYVNALAAYWTLYYTLRSITLYDFEKQIPISEDFDLLIK